MIEYKGIKFSTVDQLIEYQEKAEGLKKPVQTLLDGIKLGDPPPFYPRQIDPWTKYGPSSPPLHMPYDTGIRINNWTLPLSPTCDDSVRDDIITTNIKLAR